MRSTLAAVTLVSLLGTPGLADPLWEFLDSLWPSSLFVAGIEKEGARADPDGASGTAPAGATADPNGPTAHAGATWDPNG